ncbi:MAG: hypothetical protein ACHQ7M_11990 [Chloroflexota bacterium]
MARYLVIAHQTAESPELLDRLRQLASSDAQAKFVLLVPATPVCNLWVCDEVETVRVAHSRAAAAATRLQAAGLHVIAARIGDADPIEALRDELQRQDGYAAVVISTLPPGVSRWLKMDVPARASRLVQEGKLVCVVSRTVAEPVEMPAPAVAER